MVDTIRIESPIITSDIWEIQSKLLLKQAVDCAQGKMIYTFSSGNLLGSWDSNISINVNTETFVFDPILHRPVKVNIENGFTLTIELSLHKFIEGHNLFNGFDDILEPLQRLFHLITGYFDIDLPHVSLWKIRRLDFAYNFVMTPEEKHEFFTSYSKVNYPKRQRFVYQGSGIYFKGTTTTVKFYDKGKEFRKHDFNRIKKCLPTYGDDLLFQLRDFADNLMRAEVEFHQKKLDDLNIKTVADYDAEIFKFEYNKEVEKIMKTKDTEVINNSQQVLDLLTLYEGERKARTVYSTWLMLATMEESEVKNRMPRSTLARHKKVMKDYNITWINSDFEKLQEYLKDNEKKISVIPVDFNLYSTSRYSINKFYKIAI